MQLFSLLVILLGVQLLPAAAQTVLREQIWGSVIFTMYGDRTPYILPETYALTPLGAQQLYSAGSTFRDRYVTPLTTPFSQYTFSTTINGISEYELDNDQVTMESTTDAFVVASAQAFMQGLYPPLGLASNDTFITSQSSLANGSNILGPLNGYQYPQIYTASPYDDNSIWIAGEVNCPAYTSSQDQYYDSPEYAAIQAKTAAFYARLQPDYLDGIFTNSSVGFYDAYYIWDYLQYGYTHNTSIADHIFYDDIIQARMLASELVWALNGNTTAAGSTIGGATLATRIMEALYTNMETTGIYDKMTLLFGSFEPMLSFFALAGLASDQNPQFYDIPLPGSSMVFELFSLSVNASQGYPDSSDLNVRFLFQNGTGGEAELVLYPLFGADPSQDTMPLADFINAMEDIWMPSVANWCDICSSFSVFCPDFVGVGGSGSLPGSGSGSGSDSSSHHGISAAVAGVIGAIVTLVALAILAAAVMVLGGLRIYRVNKQGKSDLGGFKGGEKLASDADLAPAKGGAGAVVTSTDGPPTSLHERAGSWEMGDQAKVKETQIPNFASLQATARPSFEDDDIHVSPFATPVKPDDRV